MFIYWCVDTVQRESSRVSLKRSSEIKTRADVQRGSVVESMDPDLSGIKQQLQDKREFRQHTHIQVLNNVADITNFTPGVQTCHLLAEICHFHSCEPCGFVKKKISFLVISYNFQFIKSSYMPLQFYKLGKKMPRMSFCFMFMSFLNQDKFAWDFIFNFFWKLN